MAEQDCYEILGIRPTASQQEVELAYKARRTQYHPDKYANADEATVQWATARMQEVNRAYNVLSDEQRRQEYDEASQPSDEEAPAGGNTSAPQSDGRADGIIPLGISHDDLEKRVYRYMASGNYTPDDMLEAATITRKESFYVPAYVFQVEYSATWSASFGFDRIESYTDYRIVVGPRGGRRREKYTAHRTVTDWSEYSGIDKGDLTVSTYAGNRLSNLAIDPACLVPKIVSEGGVDEFAGFPLRGVEAEEFSVAPSQAFDGLRATVNGMIDEKVKRHAKGDHQKDWNWSAKMSYGTVRLLVPLCHATFAYGDKSYEVWVSGRDGEAIRATSLPVDKGRQNTVYAGFVPLAAGLAGVGIGASMGGFIGAMLVSPVLAAIYGFMRRQSIIDHSKQYREALLNQLHSASAGNGISAEERALLAKSVQRPEKPALAKSDNDKVVLPILAIVSLLGAVIPGHMEKLPQWQNQPAPVQQNANSVNPNRKTNVDSSGAGFQPRIEQTPVAAAPSTPTGTYKYIEEGFNGEMKISEVSECTTNPNKLGCMSSSIFAVEVSTMAPDGSDCDLKALENVSARIASGSTMDILFSATKDDNSVVSFTVTFGPRGATIKDIEQGDLVGICGMRGSFLGKWAKAGE